MQPPSPSRVIPPAPMVFSKPLNSVHTAWLMSRSTISAWTEHAFDAASIRGQILGTDNLTIFDPALVHDVLVTRREDFLRPAMMSRPIKPLVGDGLILSEGEAWRRQRKSLAPMFSPAAVGALIPHFQAAGDGLMAGLRGKDGANLSQAFSQAALDAVLRALFSLPDDPRCAAIADLVRRYVNGPGRPNVLDALSDREDQFAFAGRGRAKMRKAWLELVDGVLSERGNTPTSGSDLLGLMLAARDDAGQPIAAAEIRDQSATMLVAGFETTARLLFWAAYLLALDPQMQARVRAEIAACPTGRIVDLKDLSHWPLLRMVLLETMRLYPPVSMLLRRPARASRIGAIEVDPATRIWISPWVIHRHRKHWEDPLAFRPERFADQPQAFLTNPAFLPFGGGPRICIGASFAMTEAMILLARLLEDYAISLPEGEPPVLPVSGVTVGPAREPQFGLHPAVR